MTAKDSVDPGRKRLSWDELLISGHKPLLRFRTVMKHVPSEPRCKICANPFGGVGGRVGRVFGFRPSRKNPNLCARCFDKLPAGGALIDIGVLFFDLRDSTPLAEAVGPAAFAGMMTRFYRTATDIVLSHEGLVDKLLGDEVMALFLPGVSGRDYRRRACEAGLALMGAMGEAAAHGAVHAGPAFVGNVGSGGITDFTALGDTVNTAARLQAAAKSGEFIVSEDLWQSVPELNLGGESRALHLRGKAEPFPVRILRP